MSRFDYTTVGHVTVDVLVDIDTHRPGGGAFYSALQAARLGLRTLIVTKGVAREIEELLAPYREQIELQVHPAAQTTKLETTGTGTKRRQRVLSWAGVIDEPIEVDTAILHLAPVARETMGQWKGTAGFVGITPQGLLRTWGEDGQITGAALSPQARAIPTPLNAAVVSDVELESCQWLASRTLLAVTAGARPTRVYAPSEAIPPGSSPGPAALPAPLQVPVPSVGEPRDDLGAGDVFAAAFFAALHQGSSPQDAAEQGNAAAAIRIAGEGPQAIGDAAAIHTAAATHRAAAMARARRQ